MRAKSRLFFPALLAAAALAPLAAADDSGSKDELAAGDWEGKGVLTTTDGTGSEFQGVAMTIDPLPPAGAPPSGGGGTPTPGGDDGPGSGVGGGDPDEGDGGGVDPGTTGPSGPPVTPVPQTQRCPAKWKWTLVAPAPALVEEKGALTLLLFRTDSWAFVCSAYCRSESTWYVDWIAGTSVDHAGGKSLTVRLSLEGACPDCKPEILLTGQSQLLAKAQVKAGWGGVDPGTTADSSASSVWAGPIDGSASCSARARPESAGSSVSAGGLGVEGEGTVKTGYSFAQAQGGKGDSKAVQQADMVLVVSDKTAIATDAGGTECNAQAKANAGYRLDIRAKGGCGDTALLTVDIVER